MTRPPCAGLPPPDATAADGAAVDDDAALAALFDAFRDGRSPAAQIAQRLRRVLAEEGEAPRVRPGTSRPS
ncbi:hypothetical protein [Rubrivivax gelatinosus]|nr:hypothetical protein [Rubrivivax gelatinosus]MBG6081720.1 hypothetical protein [Rubrivivax gelatinosus]